MTHTTNIHRALPALLLGSVLLLIVGCAKPRAADSQPAAFWPSYPDEPRLQYLTSLDSSKSIAPEKSALDRLVYGKETEQVLAVKKPYGLQMHNGRIYVCDIRNACVTVLDLRNNQTLILGRSGTDTLQRPVDIAVSDDGFKYVADMDRGRIYVFDAGDRAIGTFGDGQLKPSAVAVHQEDLYVADFKSQQVKVLNRRNGQETRTIGTAGMDEGQFIRPLGLAVDRDGNLYVSDVMKCTVQKFDPAGNVVSSFGTISTNAGGMVRPKQIDVDRDGVIYVVDAAFQNVQLMDQQGRPLTFFGSPGPHPGAMDLPAGIAVHDGDLDLFARYVHPAFEPARLILVTNQFGANKISVYALGRLKTGKTVADISASQGIVPAGTSDQKGPAFGPETLPESAPEDAPEADTAMPSVRAR